MGAEPSLSWGSREAFTEMRGLELCRSLVPESFWEESPQPSRPAPLPAVLPRLVKNGSGSRM